MLHRQYWYTQGVNILLNFLFSDYVSQGSTTPGGYRVHISDYYTAHSLFSNCVCSCSRKNMLFPSFTIRTDLVGMCVSNRLLCLYLRFYHNATTPLTSKKNRKILKLLRWVVWAKSTVSPPYAQTLGRELQKTENVLIWQRCSEGDEKPQT